MEDTKDDNPPLGLTDLLGCLIEAERRRDEALRALNDCNAEVDRLKLEIAQMTFGISVGSFVRSTLTDRVFEVIKISICHPKRESGRPSVTGRPADGRGRDQLLCDEWRLV